MPIYNEKFYVGHDCSSFGVLDKQGANGIVQLYV